MAGKKTPEERQKEMKGEGKEALGALVEFLFIYICIYVYIFITLLGLLVVFFSICMMDLLCVIQGCPARFEVK